MVFREGVEFLTNQPNRVTHKKTRSFYLQISSPRKNEIGKRSVTFKAFSVAVVLPPSRPTPQTLVAVQSAPIHIPQTAGCLTVLTDHRPKLGVN